MSPIVIVVSISNNCFITGNVSIAVDFTITNDVMTAINVAIATKLLAIAKDVTSSIDVTIANDLTNTQGLPIANNLIIANDVTSTNDATSTKYLTSALDQAIANNVNVSTTKDVTACSQPFILAVLQPCSKVCCASAVALFLPGCAVLSGGQPRGNHPNHPWEEMSAASRGCSAPVLSIFSCPRVVGKNKTHFDPLSTPKVYYQKQMPFVSHKSSISDQS